MSASTSCGKREPLGKDVVQSKLTRAWARVLDQHGGKCKGKFADQLGVCSTTVENAMSGKTVPELHTALNSLLFDKTALNEVLELYGVTIAPLMSEAANDLQVIAGMNDASSEWLNRIIDGRRCHRDTAALAKLFRPLIAKMQGVIEEADAA